MVKQTIDFENPEFYNNRELSWLSFNERVLQEAINSRNPLLERLKFLAIFSSNLDEFFMVRVAGLKDQVKAGFNKPENKSGLTPKMQLMRISEHNHKLVDRQYATLKNVLQPQLEKEKIKFLKMDNLNEKQLDKLERYFEEQIFPVLTPMAVDAYRPFPMLLNKSINLSILLEDEHEADVPVQKMAIVQVPSVLKRVVPLDDDSFRYVMLEDIITHFIFKLFKGYKVRSVTEFRITRNADMTIHEDGAQDLLKEIEKELKKRKWGAAVRLEVKRNHYDPQVLEFLQRVLEIHQGDIYEVDGPIDLTYFSVFYEDLKPLKEALVYEGLIPQPPTDIGSSENILDIVSERDVFLHHPYESFQPVLDFIADAADDPDVLAIKQTLYRVSGDSPIIKSLTRAAANGKQVTVLVELKARFDEENNLQWARELEKAGCHVIYGMTYLKTHSKITLVVKRKGHNIQRFVHLGTGNYNDHTAKVYTDMGLITSNVRFGIDATNFFNYLSGYTEKPEYNHVSMAPYDIRPHLITLIEEEIASHKRNGNGHIIMKMNSLTDKKIIMKMYEASCAGVKLELIVRGICCLRPGIKNVSENINVISIVGRFLEHSRIYYFHQDGKEKIFLASADLMTRNMDKRVELLFPIYDGGIKKRIKQILTLILSDTIKARVQDEQGNYSYRSSSERVKPVDSQLELFKQAYKIREDSE